METELHVAIDLARRAAREVMRVYRAPFEVATKPGQGPVTEADLSADRLIRDGLSSAFPGDAILSEETPDDRMRLGSRRLWLVDPLDGTNQFVRRINEFAVMIGLAIEGEAQLGVVYLPVQRRCFAAARGHGCWLIEAKGRRRRRRIASKPSLTKSATIAVSRAHFGRRTRALLDHFGEHRLLRCGSVGHKAMLVAAGTADAYFSTGTRSRHWDTCACEAIVREAGGVFVDTEGQSFVYNTEEIRNWRGILACRQGMATQLLDLLAKLDDGGDP